MNDVIPEQGLGPQNQKWRQWVERKITNLQKNMEQKFGADIANSFAALNSSMALIARQVSELAKLKTYSSSSGEAIRNGQGTAYFSNPPSVTFTTEEAMSVLISFSCGWTAEVARYSQVHIEATLNGSTVLSGADTSTGSDTLSTTGTAGTLYNSTVVSVPAGSHTIGIDPDSRAILYGSVSGSTTSVYAGPITLTASIIGVA